jgi:hypothetical protein
MAFNLKPEIYIKFEKRFKEAMYERNGGALE